MNIAGAVSQDKTTAETVMVTNPPTMLSTASAATPMLTLAPSPQALRQPPNPIPAQPATASSGSGDGRILDKRRLQELVKEIDPLEQLDEDVEDVLLQVADDFIESVVSNACGFAKHRKSSTLEVKDVQLHLERNWNMWIPGFGSDDLRPYKKAAASEAHKQRLALIKKAVKKY